MSEMTRVRIDLNVRVRGNQSFTRLANADGPLAEGQAVEVYESESEIFGPATVTEIDRTKGLVYLAVEWAKLREAVITPDAMKNFMAGVAAANQIVSPAAVPVGRFVEREIHETYGSKGPVYRPAAYGPFEPVPSRT
jgi:hypothetical protein